MPSDSFQNIDGKFQSIDRKQIAREWLWTIGILIAWSLFNLLDGNSAMPPRYPEPDEFWTGFSAIWAFIACVRLTVWAVRTNLD